MRRGPSTSRTPGWLARRVAADPVANVCATPRPVFSGVVTLTWTFAVASNDARVTSRVAGAVPLAGFSLSMSGT